MIVINLYFFCNTNSEYLKWKRSEIVFEKQIENA